MGDVQVTKALSLPKDGKSEVIFPVCMPDEGTFDWLDMFIEKNPEYVELSDRKIVEWCVKSGVVKPPAQAWKDSRDRPEMNFGIPELDNMSVRRLLVGVAPLQPRKYVVMEVKASLVQEERKEMLTKFAKSQFKRSAYILVGKPKADFLDKVHEELRSAKQ